MNARPEDNQATAVPAGRLDHTFKKPIKGNFKCVILFNGD